MTESEAKHILEHDSCYECSYGVLEGATQCRNTQCNFARATNLAINALEKQIAKKPVCKEKSYSEELGFSEEWHCPTCGAYVGYFTEGMNEPEQMEYCNECGQHIARDWSEV